MSRSLQYLILMSFMIEPYQNLYTHLQDKKNLRIKAKLKYGFYAVVTYFKQQLFSLMLFLVVGFVLVYQTPSLFPFFIYLVGIPFILVYSDHFLHLILLLFLPLLFLNYPSFLLVFYVISFLVLYHKTPTPITYIPSDRFMHTTKFILPFLFVVYVYLQNHAHALFQQILVLSAFVAVISLETSLTETKTLLDASRNRYILWHLKSNHFNFKFLSRNNQITLYQQASLIFYICVLVTFTLKDYWIVLMISLCTLYLLFAELDKMIQYKFFNQSILYDDLLTRFVFSQIMLSAISFYLIFLGIQELLILRDIPFTPSVYIKFGFIAWYSAWIYIFYRRFDKKIKLHIRKFALVFLLILMSACSKVEFEHFVVSDQRFTFSGNMVHQHSEIIPYSSHEQIELHVSHGEEIETGDILFSLTSEALANERLRLKYQLEKIDSQMSALKEEINKTEDELIKKELEIQLRQVQDEHDLIQFDLSLIKTTNHTKANFDATVYLKDGNLELVSKTLILELKLNEQEYRHFKEITSYHITSIDGELMHTSHETMVLYQDGFYTIQFAPFEHACYVNQTLLVLPSEPLYVVPKRFVKEQDAQLMVQTAETEVLIEATYDELKKTYLVNQGLKEGDELLAYE